MDKKRIVNDTLFDILVDVLQNTAVNFGSKLIESVDLELAPEIVANVALESGMNILPIIGSVYQSYRTNKKLERQEKLIILLKDRLDSFIERTTESAETKEKYSSLLEVAIESVADYSQEEKITYLSEGMVSLFNTSKLSFDISYLYINTLNELTLLDIGVLKFYYKLGSIDYIGSEISSQDVINEFDIEYYQYEAIRENLYRLGLLRQKKEKNEEKDFKNIFENLTRLDKNVAELYRFMTALQKNSKSNKLKNFNKGKIKFETSERYEISKFGREFNKYFLKEQ